jgi:hypothetical protein
MKSNKAIQKDDYLALTEWNPLSFEKESKGKKNAEYCPNKEEKTLKRRTMRKNGSR